MEKLKQWETMTLAELFQAGGYPGKHYQIEEIPTKEACDRLEAIGLGDMTRISVLRSTGPERLFGFLEGHVFHVVWWDPHHQVWPSRLRNT